MEFRSSLWPLSAKNQIEIGKKAKANGEFLLSKFNVGDSRQK